VWQTLTKGNSTTTAAAAKSGVTAVDAGVQSAAKVTAKKGPGKTKSAFESSAVAIALPSTINRRAQVIRRREPTPHIDSSNSGHEGACSLQRLIFL
jgi:hypothetical protein